MIFKLLYYFNKCCFAGGAGPTERALPIAYCMRLDRIATPIAFVSNGTDVNKLLAMSEFAAFLQYESFEKLA